MTVGRVVWALCASLFATSATGQSITAVSPANLAPIGGVYVTLSGTALGSGTLMTPTVFFGTTTMATTTSWVSFTSVTARAASGAGKQHEARYTELSKGINVALASGVTYDGPLITNFLGQNGATSGSSTLTVTGINFAADNRSPTIIVGGSVCLTTSWFSDTSVRCAPVPASGGIDYVSLEVATLVGSTTRTFSYDAPVITSSTTVNTASTAAASLTVSGFNFALLNPSLTASIGPFQCTTSSWMALTSVLCQQPLGGGSNLAIGVTLGDSSRSNTGLSFSFDAPVVTSDLPTNAPTTGGTVVTLSGLNFAGSDPTLTVTIGASCSTTSWTTSSSVVCVPPTTSAAGPQTVLTSIAGAAHSAVATFSFDPPTVTSSAALNSPVTAGTTITISGVNFRVSDTSSTVLLGVTTCSTTSWRSDTSVVCAVPAGQPTLSANTNFLINGVVGTGLSLFTYDSPVLTSSKPANGATSGDTRVTVNGFNFGSMDYSLTVAITGSDGFYPENCKTVLWVSDNELQCVAAGGEGASLSVYLTAAGTQFRAVNVFSFDSPVVTFFGAANGPTSTGASLTLQGFNFGKFNRSPNVLVGAAGTRCATTAWTSGTQLTCLTPTGFAERQNLRVVVRDLVYTVTSAYSYDAPVLTQFAQPNGAVLAGTTVTIYGTNFALEDRSATAKIGSTICGSTSWSSATAVTCALSQWYPIPSEGIGSKLVTLTNSGQVGCKAGGFTYDLPVMTNAQRPNAPSTSGAVISISGLNFNSANFSPTARVGSSVCVTTSWVSATSFTCASPVGTTSNLAVSVVLSDLVGSAGSLFSFDTAVITRSSASNAATTAGSTLTLSGFNFGAAAISGTAQISSSSCSSTQWVTDTSVVCAVPPGSGQQLRLGYTSGATGLTTPIFTYDSPVVTRALVPNLPTSAGGSVTIFGVNFAQSDGTLTANVGATQCGTVSWSSPTQIICAATSPGTSRDHKIHVELATLATLVAAFTYDAPVLTATLPANQPTSGYGVVTVSGVNFATVDFSQTFRVGGTVCATSSWSSSTSIACTPEKGTGLSKSVSLSIATLVGSTLPSFTYDSPVVTFVNRFNGVVSGGTSVTLTGLNFGSSDATLTASTGQMSKTCATASWTTGTSVVCALQKVPQSVSETNSFLTVTLEVESRFGTSFRAFTYDAPTVTLVRPANMPTTSGAVITVLGHNYGSADSAGTPAVAATIGATACATTEWLVETAVRCISPNGSGAALNAAISFKGLSGNAGSFFSYDSPVVTDGTMNGPTSAGTTLTVSGFNMGFSDPTPSLMLTSTICVSSSWTSVTQVTCASSASTTEGNGRAQFGYALTIGSLAGSLLNVFSFDGPIITNIKQPNAPPSSGAVVTVSGMNFVQPAGNPSLSMGSVACSQSTYVSGTSMTCVPAVGSGQDLTVTTTLQLVVGTMLLAYSYDAPSSRRSCAPTLPPHRGRQSQFWALTSARPTRVSRS